MDVSMHSSLTRKKTQRHRSEKWITRTSVSHYVLSIFCFAASVSCETTPCCRLPLQYTSSSVSQTSLCFDQRSDFIESSNLTSVEIDSKHIANGEAKSASAFVSCLEVRGGDDTRNVIGDVNNLAGLGPSPESIIAQFLSYQGKYEDKYIKDCDGKFHVQGWRWHTLSFARDSNRLQHLATKMLHLYSQDTTASSKINMSTNKNSLTTAVNYVIDFNLKGLQRIENDLFFPWLREKLTTPSVDAKGKLVVREMNNAVIGAFRTVLDEIDYDRSKVAKLAAKLKEQANLIASSSVDNDMYTSATSNIVDLSTNISTLMRSISTKEECLLIPAVAKLVSSKEQKSFNSRVLRKLGFLEARIHLVGMHDAVHDDSYGNEEERALFEHEIPALPKMMISRWRRTLYLPQAGMLDDVVDNVE